MNKNRLVDYLEHIQLAAKDACSYITHMSEQEFLEDKRTQQAVIMNLVIIGEASAKVMDSHTDFTKNNPQIAWRGMRGMRNRITHGYFEIDLVIV
jgi:uncharacterized protein with HEPN domain